MGMRFQLWRVDPAGFFAAQADASVVQGWREGVDAPTGVDLDKMWGPVGMLLCPGQPMGMMGAANGPVGGTGMEMAAGMDMGMDIDMGFGPPLWWAPATVADMRDRAAMIGEAQVLELLNSPVIETGEVYPFFGKLDERDIQEAAVELLALMDKIRPLLAGEGVYLIGAMI